MYARLQSVVVIKRHVVHTLATNMPAEMYSRLFQLSQWSSGIEPCAIIEVVAGTNPLPTVAFRIHGGDSENFLARPPRQTFQATATKATYSSRGWMYADYSRELP